MKRVATLIIFLWICTFSTKLYPQYVGFSNAELASLKKSIRTETVAKKQYAILKELAISSLYDAPMPADTIFSEGILAGNPKKIRTQASLKDIQKAYALALVYKLEGGKQYLEKATDFINAWASINKPQGNPINDTKLDALIEAYDMIKKELPEAENQRVKSWLTVLAEKEVKRKLSNNNWNSHRVKMIGMAAYAIGDTALQHYCKTAFETQIEKNLNADGSGFDFLERDALHYHVYTLEPLLKLAIIIKRAEAKDYYAYVSKSGSSISNSISFLAPYLTGEKTHAEFVNSKVAFDRARANNNEAAFKTGALFDPKHGLKAISLASYFNPAIINIIAKKPVQSYWLGMLQVPSY